MKHEESVLVPRYLLRTLTPAGYFSRFYELVQASALSHVQAWEAIEGERAAVGLPPGYTSPESCRVAKSRLFRAGLVRIMED
ncbi:MAG: hypothetical protein KDD06_17120 [Phaeodactylibacter sp.]|nr:hypothetical protein [Phaeodactylibacter sp.]